MIGAVFAFLPFIVIASESGAMQHAIDPDSFDRSQALAISQGVIGEQLGDYLLTDISGNQVRLEDLYSKPLIISLIYTSCYHICPMTTRHLRDVVEKARDTFGDEFNVVSIGFDTLRDSPPMMKAFAAKQDVQDDQWMFLSGDSATLKRLTAELGFQYFPSPSGFDHLIQSSVVKAGGEVYRQLYGINFKTPLLIEPLKELLWDEKPPEDLIENVGNRIRLFCTVYDAKNDRYHVDYSIFIGTFIGIMCVGLVGFALFREWRKTLRS
jgi:protein SCO1/2